MKEYRIASWTPGNFPDECEHFFGCASYGFATENLWKNPDDSAFVYWDHKLNGKTLSGTYKQVLQAVSELDFAPVACIALFNKGLGIESFIRQYSQVMPEVPLIGGGAALGNGQTIGELIPESEDLVLLAVADGSYELQSINIYNKTNISVEVKKQSPRQFEELRVLPDGEWQNALEFYFDQQKIRNIDENNFELMTFCDNHNRNIHCSISGSFLKTGANLPNDGILQLVATTNEDAQAKFADFIIEGDSLIFGCAGVRSLLPQTCLAGKNSLCLFLFGELVTQNEMPMFGNLMLAKFTKK